MQIFFPKQRKMCTQNGNQTMPKQWNHSQPADLQQKIDAQKHSAVLKSNTHKEIWSKKEYRTHETARANKKMTTDLGKAKWEQWRVKDGGGGARKVKWICGVEYQEMAAPPEQQLQQLIFAGVFLESKTTRFTTLCILKTASSFSTRRRFHCCKRQPTTFFLYLLFVWLI